MAQTNFTDDENQKTFRELSCSVEFLRSVDGELIFIDGNKREQTSRLVAGAQIQTNFEKNMYNRDRFLDCFYCRVVNFILEFSYNFVVAIHSYSYVSSHHNLRLRKNFLSYAS